MAQTSRSADLTSGPMLQKIILFSIPLAASSLSLIQISLPFARSMPLMAERCTASHSSAGASVPEGTSFMRETLSLIHIFRAGVGP